MLRKKKDVYCHHASEYEIQFFDVDSMNIMWHGHYVKYLEMARCAFLDEIHYTYDVMKEKGYGWPIVRRCFAKKFVWSFRWWNMKPAFALIILFVILQRMRNSLQVAQRKWP